MRKTIILKINSNSDKIKHLGMIVTGFYNVANYDRRESWHNTGKIPNYYQQYYTLRDHKLARLLHSHIPQQILKTLDSNYKSWYKLRKNGHPEANPPLFRKKGKPSTFHFTNYGFTILNDTEIQLSTKNTFGQNLVIKVEGRPELPISQFQSPKILQFVFKDHKVVAHLVYEVATSLLPPNDKIVAIDLGIKNFATTYDTNRVARIYKGGEIQSIMYYYNKQIAKLQSLLPKRKDGKTQKYSQLISKLHRKKTAKINHILHCYANDIRNSCVSNDYRTVVIGILKNIRLDKNGDAKDFGNRLNLKIHSWAYHKFKEILSYKLAEVGITLAEVSEKFTSRTCPMCNNRRLKNRFTRGNYKCSQCGYRNHSDIIGAMNLLTRYQYGELTPNCNSHVNQGCVIKWSADHLLCTEALVFIQG